MAKEITIENFFLTVEEHIQKTTLWEKEIQKELEFLRKKSSIAKEESELAEKKDSIVSLFKNTLLRNDYNLFHEKLATHVEEFVLASFRNYAQKDIEERMASTQNLIFCFDTLLMLYNYIAHLPNKKEVVDDLFSREVWSPVTYTYMTEVMKERIYNAYKNHLVPYVIQEIINGLNCEVLFVKMQNILLLNDAMYKLRDQDTSKQERELRRVSDPLKILEILKINLY